MSIESLSSSNLRALDTARTSRDKPREVKAVADKNDSQHTNQVTVIRAGNADSIEKAETFSQHNQSINNNSLSGKEAIAAYQSIEKEQERQNIQLLLGVDTFV
ncbi:hypothetical protein RS130_12320 [Paraglaciecola aquimarina]|uniref:Uncharacterized protein n=1 Tax=Paraglaciecola aquimarina TaxID=1235557 RepID=A0ABU3SXA0_9ALTE|nr:hypothetical protein [Paraglaciecola aquimarina]MDU0354602.1 hypothetical protein [Paraglaciecola aquimarina]